MLSLIQTLGKKTLGLVANIGEIFILVGKTIRYIRYFHQDRILYNEQLYRLGVKAIPLVAIIAVFAGAVAGWQGAYQLEDTLPPRFFGQIVAIGILSEMGPVLTALVLAGRNGSSIGAEIATMKVTEQIDALEVMAINPIRHLVTPRVVAMVIMLPLLVVVADIIALFTAAIIGDLFFNISVRMFFNSFQSVFVFSEDVLPSIMKALSFGISIGLISCWVGLKATRGASGVGRAAIQAFVFSATIILINDYIVATLVF
ncbi:MAG: ABC transporter permease [Candidatus Marinimicrobia bacterium]|nr:ABC transporter permease [Candidatus Neomarinimicrobiota bacterium]